MKQIDIVKKNGSNQDRIAPKPQAKRDAEPTILTKTKRTDTETPVTPAKLDKDDAKVAVKAPEKVSAPVVTPAHAAEKTASPIVVALVIVVMLVILAFIYYLFTLQG